MHRIPNGPVGALASRARWLPETQGSVLGWFTANIGIHHIHHLCSRIPFYRLRDVLRDHPSLQTCGRVTLAESVGGVRVDLGDEAGQRLVSFREVMGSPLSISHGRESGILKQVR